MSLDLNSLSAALHSIKVSNGTYDLAIDSNGYLTIANSSFAVTAADLDIRDLDYSLDNVAIKSASGVNLAIDSNGYLTITNSSFAVTAADLDIRDLDYTLDNVAIKSAAGVDLAIDSNGYLTITNTAFETTPSAYDTWKVTAQTVTNSASELASTPLAGRINMVIQNLGSVDVYINFSNAVSTSNGLLIAKGFSQEIALDAGADVWAITASGSSDVRIAEYSA